ncbi:response regulator [Polycyclovorans algicola]|uniref:response regulator n=1 Tax=Polycyclovorans algicola TaxID=616992 RepID=UPI0006948E32|nr:response regulator [Polycyclovorans algicola]
MSATPHATEITDSRILIIDDQVANVELLETTLLAEGFQNLAATTEPANAYALCCAFQPDLIMLDLKMPVVDGYAVLSRLAELRADQYLPVVVLTADVSRAARHKALGLGATDFLTKPLDNIEVMLRVWNLLEARQLYTRLRALGATDGMGLQARRIQALGAPSDLP